MLHLSLASYPHPPWVRKQALLWCLAPIIPTVHHIHVPVHICHPGFWANPSKMKSFVDVARHFLCFRPIHKLLSGAKCKSTPGARSRSPGEGADGTSLMQILSREIWGGHCGRAGHWIVINCDTNEAGAGAGLGPCQLVSVMRSHVSVERLHGRAWIQPASSCH